MTSPTEGDGPDEEFVRQMERIAEAERRAWIYAQMVVHEEQPDDVWDGREE